MPKPRPRSGIALKIAGGVASIRHLLWSWRLYLFPDPRLGRYIARQSRFMFGRFADRDRIATNAQHWWTPGNKVVVLRFSERRFADPRGYVIRTRFGRFRPADANAVAAQRFAAALNLLQDRGARGVYTVDMMDMPVDRAPQPSFCHARKDGRLNRILWPLDRFHTLGRGHFPKPRQIDPLAFEDKRPMLAWHGRMTDRVKEGGRWKPIDELVARYLQGDWEDRRALIVTISRSTRFRLMNRYFDHARCHFRADPYNAGAMAEFDHTAPWFADPQPPEAILRFRYIVAADGPEMPNLLYRYLAANSVVFKIDTGWAAFLDGNLRPWEHYVPVKKDLSNLIEHLDWCEAHPSKCAEIIRNAHRAIALAQIPWIRRRVERQVVRKYERRFADFVL